MAAAGSLREATEAVRVRALAVQGRWLFLPVPGVLTPVFTLLARPAKGGKSLGKNYREQEQTGL